MTSPSPHHVLEIEHVGDVTVVKFTNAKILDYNQILLIGRQLNTLVESGGVRRLLLNFGRVERLSTALVGKVIEMHRRMQAIGGEVALCSITPRLREIFDLLRLPMLLPIHSDEQHALEKMQPAGV
jgi:anti-anti-sigma factor